MRLFCASRFPLASKWASLHAEEQWRQGDTEAAMQMPVSPMCQRIADDEQTKRQHVCTRTVTALTDAHLSYFTPDAIKALCKKHPPLRVRLQRQAGLTML